MALLKAFLSGLLANTPLELNTDISPDGLELSEKNLMKHRN
ncbi:hypothetical protein [Listeria seeligeri]|nr:hypothetical protein [Listeria seeligeri]